MMLLAVVCLVGASFGDVKTLVWNGVDGAKWEEANWLDGETPSAWVDGANAIFSGTATVSLSGAVTVSNLTASGALTLVGVSASSYSEFLTSDDTLVFSGLSLADITAIDGTMAGGNFGATPEVPSHAYLYDCSGKTGSAQFQCNYYNNLRCIRVELTEKDDGVHAKAVGRAGYLQNFNTSGEILGGDAEDMAGMRWNQNIATGHDESGYGVCDLKASTARLQLVGETSFGGALTVSNAEVIVTAPISQTWGQPVSVLSGRLAVKGLSDATEETTYGITAEGVGIDYVWLTANANDTVFTNMVLSRTVPVSIVMAGSTIGISPTANLYHSTFNGQSMTLQFQFAFGSYIKGCTVELIQDGANVKARFVRSYYHPDGVLGEDMEHTDGVTSYTSATGNGVKSMLLRTVSVPSLTLSGGNSDILDVLCDNSQAVFANASARPGRLVARNASQVIYSADNGNGSGAKRIIESGSVMMPLANMTSESLARYVFDGATLRTPMLHGTHKDGCNYCNYLTLKNGAAAEGNPIRCGFGGVRSNGSIMTYRSEGVGHNVIASGIALVNCQINNGGVIEPNTTSPNTLVIETSADLDITGVLRNYADANYYGARVTKRGAATLTLSGENTFDGRFTIEEGTVVLGSDGALPSSAPLTLAGGTMSCGTTVNETGALTLSGDATINLGDGTLAFADSSGETWVKGATLNITGPEPISAWAIRFGTSANGLTSAQRRAIRYNGNRVDLDDNGYLGGPKALIISFR